MTDIAAIGPSNDTREHNGAKSRIEHTRGSGAQAQHAAMAQPTNASAWVHANFGEGLEALSCGNPIPVVPPVPSGPWVPPGRRG